MAAVLNYFQFRNVAHQRATSTVAPLNRLLVSISNLHNTPMPDEVGKCSIEFVFPENLLVAL